MESPAQKFQPRTDPLVIEVDLPEPSLADNTADADRLVRSLAAVVETDELAIDLHLVRRLPDLLRKSDYRVKALVFADGNGFRVLHAAPAGQEKKICGLAVDLGTTRVVLRLVDLAGAETLAETGLDNPQLEVGPDVLTRIHHAAEPEGLAHLNCLIMEGLNRAIAGICADAGIASDQVHLMAVAGNTVMTHLFLGLDPRWIIREPYIPVINRPGLTRASDLGLNLAPGAMVYPFPNVGSYFGGDLLAGIIYAGLDDLDEPAILVDVGTNAEVVLGNSEWMVACAGAAGPALEGGVTRMGMMAGPGVIDKVRIDPQSRRIEVRTIGNRPPVGICGSGLIDLAAQLFVAGMIDIRGKFRPEACGRLLTVEQGLARLTVVPAAESGTGRDLTISQADLDSLIRSKAAMYTILETITATVAMDLNRLERFYVAGTFGSFIDPRSAITIGMLPDLPLDSYHALGNSSLGGATLALLSRAVPGTVTRIRDRITYLELNVNQDFMNRFSAAKFIPHTDLSRFPSVKAALEGQPERNRPGITS